MLNFETALKIARDLPDVSEQDHFGSNAFKAGGRIFATFWPDKNQVNLRLSLDEQKRVLEEPEAFQEIPNSWGRQGWTTCLLEYVGRTSFRDALGSALKYSEIRTPVSKKKPAQKRKVSKKTKSS